MKQQYRMKIQSMQKFIPFLSKLLERLKTDLGNESQIVKIQLFLDMLKCPDASVTIEELDKCEHELCGLYKSYENVVDSTGVPTAEFQECSETAPCEVELQRQSPIAKTLENDAQTSQNINQARISENQMQGTESVTSSETLKRVQSIEVQMPIPTEAQKTIEHALRECDSTESATETQSYKEHINPSDEKSDVEKIVLFKEFDDSSNIQNISKESIISVSDEEEINTLKSEKFQSSKPQALSLEESQSNENLASALENSQSAKLTAISSREEEEINTLKSEKFQSSKPQPLSLEESQSNENLASALENSQSGKPTAISSRESKSSEPIAFGPQESPTSVPDESQSSERTADILEEYKSSEATVVSLKESRNSEPTTIAPEESQITVTEPSACAVEKSQNSERTSVVLEESQSSESTTVAPDESQSSELTAVALEESQSSETTAVCLEESQSSEPIAVAPDESQTYELTAVAVEESESSEATAEAPDESQSSELTSVAVEDSEDGELEENVEIVKYPEVDSNEMILPDSAEDDTIAIQTKEEDRPGQSEKKTVCQKEFTVDDDPTAEPELIVFASGTEHKEDEKHDNYDPLNVDESSNKTHKNETKVDTAALKDDDDDDVQVIETRNSPICVDSDDDSEPLPITSNTNNTIKNQGSTKKAENVAANTSNKTKVTPAQQKRTKIQPNVNIIIDTIDLLDSSDEEDKKCLKPTMISPGKRCLLPKTIRQSKRKRSPSTPTTSLKPQVRTTPKPPTQLHISTPQSNFLNAVNLRPVNILNPPAFSAQLLNKNVIIPNAFYGNPPEMRSKSKLKSLQWTYKGQASATSKVTEQQEKIYRRWLDNFLINFASPLQIASHTCFVLLQRLLKHKFFQKLKEARTNLNVMAQRQISNETPASLDIQLMLDLRNVLFTNESQLSDTGLNFCELASSKYYSKPVPLTTDIKSKRVTSRTRVDEELSTPPNKYFNGLPKVALNQTNGYIKKSKKDDGDEYTPNKPVIIGGEGGDSGHGERKRTLRRNRSKRYDNNFSYNEDQNDDEYDEEDDSYAAIARKVEQKRREAQQKRERMAKSFESAFIEAFSKQIDASAAKRKKLEPENQPSADYKNIFTSPAGIRSAAGSVAIDNSRYGNFDSLGDEPKEHRIYKVTPPAPYTAPKRQNHCNLKNTPSPAVEIITCSDGSDDNDECAPSRKDLAIVPKNTNRSMFPSTKNNDITNSFCIICRRQVQRIVHHYVNQHRGCEVYTSRLSAAQLTQLRRNNGNMAKISTYKNGQHQYEATCPFCQKRSRFMLSYWYQHFTMHTGEYCYRCSCCGTRKPTRPLLLAHLKTPCRKGASVCQDFIFEARTNQIEARVCTLCNYIQLHRSNVVKHLRTQHGLQEILPKHIQSVVLLKLPSTVPTAPTTQIKSVQKSIELDPVSASSTTEVNSTSNLKAFFNDDFEAASTVQFNYEDDDPSDDLSFMICGMLDVQMNTD